jgi:fructokinase
MLDVVALGEILIDFTPAGISPAGNELFERNPGGAPANVLTAISKLGGSCAFIGKVGKDQFGCHLESVLKENRIETKGLRFSDDVNTTLAFVHLNSSGDRSFSFYRQPGADLMLDESDLDFSLIEDAKIFHFGSLSLTDEPARSATIKAVEHAKQNGKIISYDPNWRPPLWKSDEAAKQGMILGLQYADILKISETELQFLTGTNDLEIGSKMFFDKGIKLIVITLGAKGCFYRCSAGMNHLLTYDTKVVDTTGSGDAFLGGLLYHISRLNCGLYEITKQEMESFIDFSNAAGALCAAKKGAIPAMPTREEIEYCGKNVPKLNVPS